MRIEGCSLRITLVALVAWKTLPNCAVKNISHPTTYKKIFPTYCLVAWCLFTEWECNKTPQNLQAFFSVLEAFLLGLGNFFLGLETVLDIEKKCECFRGDYSRKRCVGFRGRVLCGGILYRVGGGVSHYIEVLVEVTRATVLPLINDKNISSSRCCVSDVAVRFWAKA